jgi:hypothetical protein
MYEPSVRERRVRGRVQSWSEAVQRPHAADLRRKRYLAERDGLSKRLHWRSMLRHLQPERQAVQRSDPSNL